jgi:hypothetical protein
MSLGLIAGDQGYDTAFLSRLEGRTHGFYISIDP